ncbi:MAG TPA: alpha/beta fold hydrolase [Myxococcaceae bacterium]|nr:alpha/beta fold hydrolase [Myxococcaceae bacterium]
MRLPRTHVPVVPPTVDEVAFRDLYRKSHYSVETSDGWTLVVTRYEPTPQSFPQPLLGEPLLLVHGFSQNRHAWTSGEFVKNLLYFGLDIHIVELRGHGKSSQRLQHERSELTGRPVPPDVDYGWDLDSYFLHDLPAAVAGVKERTGRPRIFYCGHSMGGMLGYGYAGLHDDLEGLITIGAPADLGRGFLLLRLAALTTPVTSALIDAGVKAINVQRRFAALARLLRMRAARFARLPAGDGSEPPEVEDALTFNYVPVDEWLKALEKLIARAEVHPLYDALARRVNWLSNPSRVSGADIRWLLREGGEREPRRALEQFARWVRRGELVCYRTGYDYKQGFTNISVPMAIIFGDLDPLASVESTRSVYRAARSEYLLWRPVKGNSHIELTMGHDIRQICYDIKNLVEYARTHRTRGPSLPRLRKSQ